MPHWQRRLWFRNRDPTFAASTISRGESETTRPRCHIPTYTYDYSTATLRMPTTSVRFGSRFLTLKPRSHCYDFRPDCPRLIVDVLIVASRGPQGHNVTLTKMLRSTATMSYDPVRFYYVRIRTIIDDCTTRALRPLTIMYGSPRSTLQTYGPKLVSHRF